MATELGFRISELFHSVRFAHQRLRLMVSFDQTFLFNNPLTPFGKGERKVCIPNSAFRIRGALLPSRPLVFPNSAFRILFPGGRNLDEIA